MADSAGGSIRTGAWPMSGKVTTAISGRMACMRDTVPGSNALQVSNGVTTVIASRDIEAMFAEIDAPIIKALDLDLAGRWEHYEGTGSNFSPQATLRYQQIPEATLRVVGSHGFRARPRPRFAKPTRTPTVAA